MGNLGGILGTLLGIAGLLGFAGAVVNGKRKDGTIDQLTISNNDYIARDSEKDKTILDLQSRLKVANEATLAADKIRQTAVDLATSRPDFNALGVQMLNQHKELLRAVGKQTTQLANLAKIISKERK